MKVNPLIRTPGMASKTRIEDAQVKRNFKFTHNGTAYRVFETSPKRTQDVLRFELWKDGATMPYVVSFQDAQGDSFGCSCPAGKFKRADGPCKHVRMCRAEFLTASTSPRRPAPTKKVKALPAPAAAQLALCGLDEVDEIEKELQALRAEFRVVDTEIKQKQSKLAEILRKGKLLADRLEKAKARRAA